MHNHQRQRCHRQASRPRRSARETLLSGATVRRGVPPRRSARPRPCWPTGSTPRATARAARSPRQVPSDRVHGVLQLRHCPWAARLGRVAAAVRVGAAPGGQGGGEVTALPLPWSASWRRGAPLGWASTARCAGKRRTETTRLEENSRVAFSFVVVLSATRSEQVSIPPLWITVANATLWRAVNADRPGAEQNEGDSGRSRDHPVRTGGSPYGGRSGQSATSALPAKWPRRVDRDDRPRLIAVLGQPRSYRDL